MIRISDLTLIFRDRTGEKRIFDRFSCEIKRGETVAIMGPSGCGKTSFLRLLARLISPTLGNVARETERISYLFQDPALLPWLSAADNVNLVLSDRRRTFPLACEWLSRVGLFGEERSYPAALSGGMQQRVALARTLAAEADLLLLDEPFRGLDEALHGQMRELIAAHTAERTVLLVTHDRADLAIADRVLLLSPDAAPHFCTVAEFH